MGAYFTAMILDIAHGWIGSSSDSDRLITMSEEQIAEWQGMEDRHEKERQAFLRGAFHG